MDASVINQESDYVYVYRLMQGEWSLHGVGYISIHYIEGMGSSHLQVRTGQQSVLLIDVALSSNMRFRVSEEQFIDFHICEDEYALAFTSQVACHQFWRLLEAYVELGDDPEKSSITIIDKEKVEKYVVVTRKLIFAG